MDKTYFEIKITFVHILILLIAIVLLGIGLFYMGYRAGHQATAQADVNSPLQEAGPKSSQTTELTSIEDRPVQPAITSNPPQERSNPEKRTPDKPNTQIPANPKNAAGASSQTLPLYTVRVGAFSNPDNANRYAESFRKRGLEAKVFQVNTKADKPLYHVWVGKYTDLENAKEAKAKLEEQEKKKFLIVSYQ